MSSSTRLAWSIHWGALAVLLVLMLVVGRRDLDQPPPGKGGLDLRGLATMMLAMVLLAYASITTLLMRWLSRHTLALIVLHILGLGAGLAALCFF